MLPAAHRLRSSRDFTSTTRLGAKCTRGPVVAYVLSSSSGEPARVGLIVNKSVGNSVVRHGVARRLREAARPLIPTLPSGTQVVLRALPGLRDDELLGRHVEEAVACARSREAARP